MAVDLSSAALIAACIPVVILGVLVLKAVPLVHAAWLAVGVAALLAGSVYQLPARGLGVAVARGTWTGVWILGIVLPALLLFEVLERSGALDYLAGAARALAPTPGRQTLLIAWVLPSFLQGAAGFGAPIAMTSPMLVKLGMSPVSALAACLVGYQWSVTFGSMGSSFFMATATAGLDAGASSSLALRAGLILGVNALLSGGLVLWRRRMEDNFASDLPVTLLIGAVMGATLVAVVVVQPALGSTAAGLAGLFAAWFVLPADKEKPPGREVLHAALPYVVLTALVAVAYGLPPVRDVLAQAPTLAPRLPESESAFGHVNPAGPVSPEFHVLLHPWIYLVAAAAVGAVSYSRRGWWPAGTSAQVVREWGSRSWRASLSIIALTILSALMSQAGMVAAIASILASLLGIGFLVVSPLLGAFGTILTGSTTASNALFSSLQAGVAQHLGLHPELFLSGQTAGGNVGNALSPVNIAVGAAAVGASGREGEVIRRNLGACAILLCAVIAGVLVQVWLA